MTEIKKHVDIVATREIFETNYNNGLYIEPWIVYIGNNVDGYNIIYSNDENKNPLLQNPDILSSLVKRIEKIEGEKVYCYEEEYDNLIANGEGYITDIDGTTKPHIFDINKTYYIYEDNGPIMVE